MGVRWRSISELVEAARRRERGAFERLYADYFRLVHGIALAHVPHDEVDDVVQEVFTIVARRLHTLRNTAAFKWWLKTLTRRCCARQHRRRRPRQTVTLNSQVRWTEPRDHDAALSDALALIAAMDDMRPSYREILILRFVEGMTGPEIAERTGLTEGSVRVKLSRGMKMLRKRHNEGCA